ncbi:hypothetical protein IQ07DRAFT_637729 [Pyrenochaeta sp. DS3sAY3a]|nr:hypothetical protein IQ07DRAFT_637729 [Pyrenochaeta sp. DS3sAY3a]
MANDALPPILLIPRELREEILGYLTLAPYVFTSTTSASTRNLHRSRKVQDTYVDTRIYLPCRLPMNILATCRQLRQEALEHQAHRLNSRLPQPQQASEEEKPRSNELAERLGDETMEGAERAYDDGTLRFTIEVQRKQLGFAGYFMPTRSELSPRFRALLPLMEKARKVKIIILAGFDWWSGSLPRSPDSTQLNPASIAIGKILDCLPTIEELRVDVLMEASDMARWDLPYQKWDKVLPWLNGPVSANLPSTNTLNKVSRGLGFIWRQARGEFFLRQTETRLPAESTWDIVRKGDMAKPISLLMGGESDLEGLQLGRAVEERFERRY